MLFIRDTVFRLRSISIYCIGVVGLQGRRSGLLFLLFFVDVDFVCIYADFVIEVAQVRM